MKKIVCSIIFLFLTTLLIFGSSVGYLVIDSQEGVDVFLDGELKGTTSNTPQLFPLFPGKYVLTLQKDGYSRWHEPIVISAHRQTTINVTLKGAVPIKHEALESTKVATLLPKVGTIEIKGISPTPSTIYINKENYGKSDLRLSNFPTGDIVVEVKSGNKSVKGNFEVVEGETLSLLANFAYQTPFLAPIFKISLPFSKNITDFLNHPYTFIEIKGKYGSEKIYNWYKEVEVLGSEHTIFFYGGEKYHDEIFTIALQKSGEINLTMPAFEIENIYFKEAITLTGSNSKKVIPIIEPSYTDYYDLIWSVSDESVATVSQDGNVTSKRAGNTLLTVRDRISGIFATQKIEIEHPASFSLINGAEPESLDPHQIQGVPEHRIYEAIFEGLVAYDPKTALGIPGLAKSWESNADGTQYTFHLRDATWSDGVAITAHTVVDSWIRGLNPETASPYAWFPAMFIKGAEEYNEGLVGKEAVGIRALDDKTFQMDLVGPLPYAVDALAHYSFAVVPLHAIEKHGSRWTLPENFVGNGPYVLKEWTPQSSIKVVPNPTYWDRTRIQLGEIIYYPIGDPYQAYTMYLNGEVDWTTLIPLDRIDEASLRRDFHKAPQLATYYYVYQTEKAPFDDARVREALSISFDRQALVDNITRAGQIPAWGIVPEMAGYASLGEPVYDIARARKLLADAGYPNGVGFPKTTILYNSDYKHKAIAEYLQRTWRANLGINIELENQEWATYLSSRNTGDFQVARAGWVGDYQDPNTFLDMFVTGTEMNGGKYSNEIYDILIKEAMTASGQNRLDILMQAEDIMINEDHAIMNIYYYVTLNMIDTNKWGGWFGNTMDYHPVKNIYKKF